MPPRILPEATRPKARLRKAEPMEPRALAPPNTWRLRKRPQGAIPSTLLDVEAARTQVRELLAVAREASNRRAKRSLYSRALSSPGTRQAAKPLGSSTGSRRRLLKFERR